MLRVLRFQMYEDISYDDLNILLSKSVILYADKPVYVSDINYDKVLDLKFFSREKGKSVPLNDPLLNFTPVKLGMCNHGGAAFYLCRVPARQWCQGLSEKTLRITDFSQSNKGVAKAEIAKLKAKGLASCILGEYETLEKTIDVLQREENVVSMAFSREFALDKEMNLYFKQDKVGMYDVDANRPIYLSSKKYLKELLNARD